MARLTDRIKALEAILLAKAEAVLARMFNVPVSLRLLDDYDAVIAEARAACGQSLTPDAAPLLSSDEPEVWEPYAMQQQARLIAIGQAHMDGVAEREAVRVASEAAAQQPPKPQRQAKSPPEFVHHPNPFARA